MKRTSMPRQLVAVLTTIAAGALAFMPTASTAAPTTAAGPSAAKVAKAAKGKPTPFVFDTFAWGSKVESGEPRVTSGKTGLAFLSCTSRAGKVSRNTVSTSDLGGGVVVGAVESEARSIQKKGKVTARSFNRIGRVVVGPESGPNLTVESFRGNAQVSHDKSGYHAKAGHDGVLSFTSLPGGEPQTIPFPDIGETIELPGFGSVTGPQQRTKKSAHGLRINTTGLTIRSTTNNSVTRVGRASARLQRGNIYGLMHGRAYGSTASLADGSSISGRSAVQPLPCLGTGGKVLQNDSAGFLIPDAGDGGTTVSKSSGKVFKNGEIDAWTQSTVQSFDLGGQLQINAVKARANAHRTKSGKIKTDAKGTSVGQVIYDGEPQDIPAEGLEIPGVALIEVNLVNRTKTGIDVTALRLTLLDDTPLVSEINLGNAKVRISR